MLNKKDLLVGTVIALVMATVFTRLSSGMSLIVTFVPGVILTLVTYVWLFAKKRPLPAGSDFIPLFFTLLAVQFIHFAEEYVTGFGTRFPALYGGVPYSDNLFVVFNMNAYCVFSVACILVFTKNVRYLLIPALFFVIYGAIGNAIAHTWWSLYLGAYFPGLVTAQIYWILGPLVLSRLVGSPRVALTVLTVFTLVLIPLLTIFAVTDSGYASSPYFFNRTYN
jgi:hypothetical protein